MERERAELERMLAAAGGILKIEAVLGAARDPESPLHQHFEWDDSDAAEEYRRIQARSLIQRCNIVIDPKENTVIRAFVSLPSDRTTGGGYRLTMQVITQPDLRAQLLEEINSQIRNWSEKAQLFAPEVLPWLSNAPVPDPQSEAKSVEESFVNDSKPARKGRKTAA